MTKLFSSYTLILLRFFNDLTQGSQTVYQNHMKGLLKLRWLGLTLEWGLRICFLIGWQVILFFQVQGLLLESHHPNTRE